jgi:dihydroflavonol-4-reductase
LKPSTHPPILVTGANGLIGSALIRHLLAEGHSIRGLKRANSDLKQLNDISDKIEWIEGDVLDVLSLEKAFEGITYVIHTAAVVSFVPRDRDQMYEINVGGTANIVNAALNAKVQKLAFVSSVAALGRPDPRTIVADKPTIITEDQKWEESPLNSHYGKSKYLAELEVWRGVAEGLNTIVVNPSMVLGEGDWTRSSTQLFKYVYDENAYYTEGLINYVDVKDVAAIVTKLLFSDIKNERYIVSAGHITYKELFEKMAYGFGKKAPSKKIAPLLAEIVWRIEAFRSWLTGSRPLITKETAKTARTQFIYDGEKVKQVLGFAYNPLNETVKRVCEALKK